MSKFCTKCGELIAEGTVCSCQGQQPIQTAQQQAVPNKIGAYFNKLWSVTLQIIKTPADMLKKYVAASDIEVAFGYIGAQAIVFALFLVALFLKLDSAINGFFTKLNPTNNGFGSFLDIGSLLGIDSIKFPLAKIFFLTIIASVALSFAFAGILFFFTKMVFKGETDFKKMICVAGAKSLAAVPFTLVAFLLTFVSINIGIFIVSMGVILGYFYVATALKGAVIIDDNKAVYILFSTFVVMIIVLALVIKIIAPMYLPSTGSMFGGLKGII